MQKQKDAAAATIAFWLTDVLPVGFGSDGSPLQRTTSYRLTSATSRFTPSRGRNKREVEESIVVDSSYYRPEASQPAQMESTALIASGAR